MEKILPGIDFDMLDAESAFSPKQLRVVRENWGDALTLFDIHGLNPSHPWHQDKAVKIVEEVMRKGNQIESGPHRWARVLISRLLLLLLVIEGGAVVEAEAGDRDAVDVEEVRATEGVGAEETSHAEAAADEVEVRANKGVEDAEDHLKPSCVKPVTL